jgi:hypothetical protein
LILDAEQIKGKREQKKSEIESMAHEYTENVQDVEKVK